jgi:hypothetical protein
MRARPHLFQQEIAAGLAGVPGFDISKKKNSLAEQLAQE